MSNQSKKIEETDVLVVGGGLAGLWAAIRARELGSKVILAEKGKVSRSGVSVFCHATMAPVPDDKYDAWFKDLVEKSGYLVDQGLVQILFRENGDRLRQMKDWGVNFLQNKSGSIIEEESKGRKAILSYLYSGRQMMEAMRGEAEKRGVEFRERVMITDLLSSEGQIPTQGRISGAAGIHTKTGQLQVFPAKAVAITSGLMSLKTHTFYADNLSGDGLAMAFRSGAEIVNAEFAAGHAFGLWNRKFATGGQKQFIMNDARIINRLGERFMERYMAAARVKNPDQDGHVEFGDICRAMALEITEGRGPVYFDLRQWSEANIDKLRKVLPATMEAFDRAGINLREQPLNSTPYIPNYFSSCQAGLKSGAHGETNLEGLYAAGAAAFVGHAVTPQAVCNVFGYRAGEGAALSSKSRRPVRWNEAQVRVLEKQYYAPYTRKDGINADELYKELSNLISPYKYSFFKDEKGIGYVLDKLEELERDKLPGAYAADIHELIKILEFRNVLLLMKLIYQASLERKESRFSHYRVEYPYMDNSNWLKWIIAKKGADGNIAFREENISFDRYPAKAPAATLIPSYTRYISKG